MVSAGPAPVSRLAPCPCGSGKRYKDCCGTLDKGASTARRSTYRPAGPDWDHVAEEERDRLGTLMESALEHQVGARGRDAERLYREVLAVAPQTHDALHMLAMLRWGAGDLVDAKRLIDDALPLRPPYPAIEQNLALIVGSQQAREKSALDALCEQVLPSMFDLLRASAASPAADRADVPAIHLIGNVDGSESDDAWMLRRLARLLAPFAPVVWAAFGGAGDDLDGKPVAVPDPAAGRHPRGGVQVFVGIDIDCATWLSDAAPDRTIVIAQSARPSRWHEALRAIAQDGASPIELVVESRAKAARFGSGHRVSLPPIDVDVPAVRDDHSHRTAPFALGMIGQDGRTVARAHSIAFLRAAATKAGALHIYDPGRLRYPLGDIPEVKCISRREVGLAAFLGTLDVFLYRAREWWREGSGRELFGAMTAGVPVVCPRTSIYAEYLEHGVDALLYDGDDDALECLSRLRAEPQHAAAIGAAARATARRLFDPAVLGAAYRDLVSGGSADGRRHC